MRNLSRHALVPVLCGLLGALAPALPAQADLIINEVLGDPARDWDGDGELSYRDDEWVEILNTGPRVVDLGDYWLRDDHGSAPHIQLSGLLDAGEVRVVYGSDAVAWQQANGRPILGLSVNNTGDVIELLQTVPGTTEPFLEVVDRVAVRDHEVENDRSSGRHPDSGEWILFDALNPYEGSEEPGSTACEPSPGLANQCTSNTATERETWDAVKSRYRSP